MDRFARIVVGYHGCHRQFRDELLLGDRSIDQWQLSQNTYDWLGKGIYFWEHSPVRALRWANERHGPDASVIGALIQLGGCFDLLEEKHTLILKEGFGSFQGSYQQRGLELPRNRGKAKKLRELDCAVINYCLDNLAERGFDFDTVRGAFLEGDELFEGTTISAETHIQIAVRNVDCIIGVFRPYF